MKMQGATITNYPRVLILIALFVAVIFFLGSRLLSKWEGEAQYIVLANSEVAALQIEVITSNLSQILVSEDFYIQTNAALEDDLFSRESWKSDLHVSKVDNSSLITMTYSSKDIDEVKSVLRGTSTIFYDIADTYYDLDDDISIRSFDSFTAKKITQMPFILLLIALVLGALLAYILEFIIRIAGHEIIALHIPKKAHQFHRTLTQKKWWESYDATKSYDHKHDNEALSSTVTSPLMNSTSVHDFSSNESEHEDIVVETIEKATQEDAKKELLSQSHEDDDTREALLKTSLVRSPKERTSTAPTNLPIAQIETPEEKVPSIDADKKSTTISTPKASASSVPGNLPIFEASEPSSRDEEAVVQQDVSEPTEEELRERLNKLLRGDL